MGQGKLSAMDEGEGAVYIAGPGRTLRDTYRSVIGMNRWSPGSLLLCCAVSLLALGIALLDQSRDGRSWWPFAIAVTAGTAMLLFQQLRTARRLYAHGCVGPDASFTATASRIRYETPAGLSELDWSAVHSLCVSSHTIYVFVTRSGAWFMPRGTHDNRVLSLARAAGVRIRGA